MFELPTPWPRLPYGTLFRNQLRNQTTATQRKLTKSTTFSLQTNLKLNDIISSKSR